MSIGNKESPQERYDRLYTKTYTVKAMLRTEQDIIARLDSVPNRAGYIKQLIRADIAKQATQDHAKQDQT